MILTPSKKTAVSLLISFSLLLNLLNSAISLFAAPSARAQEAADQAIDSAYLIRSNDILKLLKKIDTNEGRADFQLYLDDLYRRKERLISIRKDLVYQLTQFFYLQNPAPLPAEISSFQVNTRPFHKTGPELTVSNLLLTLENIIRTEESILGETDAAQAMVRSLENSPILRDVGWWEKKYKIEKDLMEKFIQSRSPVFDPLSAELRLENKLTEFYISFSGAVRSLSDDLKTYLSRQDKILLEQKLNQEKNLLRLLLEFYPEDQRDTELPDEISRQLIQFYAGLDFDLERLKADTVLMKLKSLTETFNALPAEVSPADYSSYLFNLESLITESLPDFFAAELPEKFQALYLFLSGKNQNQMEGNTVLKSHYEILKSVNTVLALQPSEIHQKVFELISGTYSFIESAERYFSSELERKNQPAPEEETVSDEVLIAPEEETVPDEVLITPEEETVSDEVLITPEEETVSDETVILPENLPSPEEIPMAPSTEPTAAAPEVNLAEDTAPSGVPENSEITPLIPADPVTPAEELKNSAESSEPVIEEINSEPAPSDSFAAPSSEDAEEVISEPVFIRETPTAPTDNAVKAELEPIIEENEPVVTPSLPSEPLPSNPSPAIQETINILEGDEKALEELRLLNQITAEDPDILRIDQQLSDLGGEEVLALLTQTAINKIVFSQIQLSAFIEELRGMNIDSGRLDSWLSFLNQWSIQQGYNEVTAEFQGISGALRFDPEDCPSAEYLQPKGLESPLDNLRWLAVSALKNPRSEAAEERASQEYQNLSVDFCITPSADLTPGNLAGKPDYLVRPSAEYTIDQKDIRLHFANDKNRKVRIVFGTDVSGSAEEKSFTVSDYSPSAVPAENPISSEFTSALENAVNTAVAEGIGGEAIIENIEIISSESAAEPADISPFILSSVEDPEQLFTPLNSYQEKISENSVVYESPDHRTNLIYQFREEPYRIVPRELNVYRIFNFGSGSETTEILFDHTVFYPAEDGRIFAYILTSEESSAAASDETFYSKIYQNGLLRAPDFILGEPFVLDRFSRLIAEKNYAIRGDQYNRLQINFIASPDQYPAVSFLRLTFTGEGQVYYNDLLTGSAGKGSLFAFAQAAGDYNGDGHADLAVGAPGAQGNRGEVSIYYYNPQSGLLDPLSKTALQGESSNYFGYSLEAGDFDGDGITDLAVGSPLYEEFRGQVWIYSGAVLQPGATLPAGSAHRILRGAGAEDGFGYTLAAGDFNSDQKTDLAISSPLDRDGQGSIQVFYQNTPFPESEEENVSLLSSFADLNFTGEEGQKGRLGAALLVRDIDQDGTDDLILSSPAFPDNSLYSKVYILYQNEYPFTKETADCRPFCSLSSADTVFEGEGSFGESLAVDDFDGDGKPDAAVGQSDFSLNTDSNEGRVYLFYQNEIPWTSLNEPCQSCAFANADAKITCDRDHALGSSLLSLDFNGDLRKDLLISADRSHQGNGSVYLFYNRESGFSSSAGDGFVEAEKDMDVHWEGAGEGSFGASMAFADFNGDQIDDLMIGAPLFENQTGGTYFFPGKFVSLEPRPSIPLRPAAVEPEIIPEETAEEAMPSEETTEGEPSETGVPSGTRSAEEVTFTPEVPEMPAEMPAKNYLLDLSVPEPPVIVCEGLESGVYAPAVSATCVWSDTAGPSPGIYRYCIDNQNSCVPVTENPARRLELINLAEHHSYLRVQTSDEGGASDISVFDLAIDHLPVFTAEPSDGGSDETKPIIEGESVYFSAAAEDQELDPYYLLVCRTNDIPIYNGDAVPHCLGDEINTLCVSSLTPSGRKAQCSYAAKEEPEKRVIWYAFACDSHENKGHCSSASQGSGAEGSPFYVAHPARYGKITITNTSDASIKPGDRLRFKLPPKNLTDVPAGKSFTLYICSEKTTGFDYQNNLCLEGSLICKGSRSAGTAGADIYCDEPAGAVPLAPVPMASGERHAHAYAEYGDTGLVDGPHDIPYSISDTPPEVLHYSMEEGALKIVPGGSAEVLFSAVLQEFNGVSDITGAEGVFFDSESVWNTCEENQQECYRAPDCRLTPLSDIQVQADCAVRVFYNANTGFDWKAHVHLTYADGQVYQNLPDSELSRTVPPLIALNHEEIAVPYKLTLPGEVTDPAEVILINLGNQPVDVLISGTDLKGAELTLPRGLQKWSFTPDFDYRAEGYSLQETAVKGGTPKEGCAPVRLPVSGNTEKPIETKLYWKILVPENQKADVYSGNVSFIPTTDLCANP